MKIMVDRLLSSKKKVLIFKHHDSDLCFHLFDILMINSMNLDHKPYLRYWNFALTSISSSNQGCDRFPSEFSKNWFPFEGNCTFFRQVQFPSRENQFFLQPIVEGLLNSRRRVSDRPSWILTSKTPARKWKNVVVGYCCFFPNNEELRAVKRKSLRKRLILRCSAT